MVGGRNQNNKRENARVEGCALPAGSKWCSAQGCLGWLQRGVKRSRLCRKGVGLGSSSTETPTRPGFVGVVWLGVPQVKTRKLDVSDSVGSGLNMRTRLRFFS